MHVSLPIWQSAVGGSAPPGGALGVSLTVPFLTGYKLITVATTIKTGDPYTITYVTAVAVGGTPPYTYQWIEDGAPSGIVANVPTLPTTYFRNYFTSPGSVSNNFFCRVTDAVAATADSGLVAVDLEATT